MAVLDNGKKKGKRIGDVNVLNALIRHRKVRSLLKGALRVRSKFRDAWSGIYTAYILTMTGKHGNDIRIQGRGHISHPRKLVIGDNVYIGRRFHFETRGGLEIGSDTVISHDVTIYTSSHDYRTGLLPYDRKNKRYIEKPVRIGRGVWIGAQVNIIPGIEIGDGAVIGLGTTVTHSIPPGAIAGNPPTRIIRFRKTPYEDERKRIKQNRSR